ncbi:hypothetical protein ACFXDH_53740 [Streptomyces sp. NPDC059467]|uniref:hypothetical protein n=1 Tax=Streptomyces sp. NPDC059467 TaxID=3346844 RepID=UPI0036CEFD40
MNTEPAVPAVRVVQYTGVEHRISPGGLVTGRAEPIVKVGMSPMPERRGRTAAKLAGLCTGNGLGPGAVRGRAVETGGEAEAPAVLDALLQARAQNPATASHVAACLDRMGPIAAPALPLLREQLAMPRRGGRFRSIDHDEELQRVGRTLVARLDPPAPGIPAARTAWGCATPPLPASHLPGAQRQALEPLCHALLRSNRVFGDVS